MSLRARAISGVGATSPLGFDARQMALFARAAKLAPRPFNRRGDSRLQVGTARVRRIPDDVVGTERMLRLAVPALQEAVLDAELDRSEPVRLLLALPEPRAWPDSEEQRLASGGWLEQLSRAAEVRVDLARSQCIRIGGPGFAVALEIALAEPADAPVVVGAIDSYHHPAVLDRLVEARRLLSDDAHGGMVPSEGAAFVVLAGPRDRRVSVASVRGAASGKELPKTWEEPRVAELLTDLIHLVSGSLSERPVTWVLPDVNNERQRAKEWSFCSYRCRQIIAKGSTVETRLAVEMGDLGAATGGMYAAYVVEALRAGFAGGQSALITLGSHGDERGVFAVEGTS